MPNRVLAVLLRSTILHITKRNEVLVMFEPDVFLESSITPAQLALNQELAVILADEPRVYEIGAVETRRR